MIYAERENWKKFTAQIACATHQRVLEPTATPSLGQPSQPLSTPEQHGSGGAVFGCTKATKDECMSRQLLGLPGGPSHRKMIEMIQPHSTALFLFNYSHREMYGVFEADAPGGMNLVPEAWRGQGSWRNGKGGDDRSPFPAQVHFRIVKNFPPLPESRFKHIMKYEPNSNRFQFNLTPGQVADLLNAFKKFEGEKGAKRS